MMRTEFGQTPDGAAWCLKALHPSDPLVELRGVPDLNCVPSTLVNYQSTFRIASDAPGSGANWNFNAQFHPNPVNFGFAVQVNDDGTLHGFAPMPNSQLAGATLVAKANEWKSISDRWRLAYFGVTVHCDAPALSNQGTLVVCQKPYEPRERTISAKNVDNVYVTFPPLVFPDGNYPTGPVGADFPSYTATVGYPNSFMGPAKDGCYIPLKLTRTFQDWHSDADMVSWAASTNALGGDNQALSIANTSYLMSYPHPNLPGAYFNTAGTALACNPFPRNGSDIVADLCGRNLSATTGFVIEVRAGFEVQALPGTTLSPMLKTPVGYDLKAIEAYALVSRELKDAYPADYNDLGKLWDVIKRVAGYLAPMLSMVPKVGTVLGPAAALLGSQASSAQVERQQAVVRRKLDAPLPRTVTLSLRKKGSRKTVPASTQKKR